MWYKRHIYIWRISLSAYLDGLDDVVRDEVEAWVPYPVLDILLPGRLLLAFRRR